MQDITLVVVTTGREATVRGRRATERATLRREVVAAAVTARPLVGTTVTPGRAVGMVAEACILYRRIGRPRMFVCCIALLDIGPFQSAMPCPFAVEVGDAGRALSAGWSFGACTDP